MRYQLGRLQTSPQLTAVIDCLFELTPGRTSPTFEELAVVDESLLFARMTGEETFRYFVGRRDELEQNLIGFVTHLGMGPLEREYVLERIASIPRRSAAAA